MIVEKKPGIYLIFCLANQRVYIGQSKNLKSRLGQHQAELRGGYHHNDYLQNAYNKYGVDMFVFRPCEYPEDTTVENLILREAYWIEQFDAMNPRRGFNMKEAGSIGRHTDETKAKISKIHKGKTVSDETKAKMSKAAKGKPKSDETKAKLSEARKGKTNTEESNAKRSASLKHRVFTDEHKANISEALFLKNKLKKENPPHMVKS